MAELRATLRRAWDAFDLETESFRRASLSLHVAAGGAAASRTHAARQRMNRLVNVDRWRLAPSLDDVLLPPALCLSADADPEGEPSEGGGDPTGAAPGSGPTRSRLVLKYHQLEGIRFLWQRLNDDRLASLPSRGCILAHSMGLGKTGQVVCFLQLLFAQNRRQAGSPTASRSDDSEVALQALSSRMNRAATTGTGDATSLRVLIVVPKSTLGSWTAEYWKWSAYFYATSALSCPPLVVLDGENWRPEERTRHFDKWTHGVTLITYDSLVNTFAARGGGGPRQGGGGTAAASSSRGTSTLALVDAVTIDLLVLDEAHRLKSASTHASRLIRNLRAARRLLLTGTPLQNHLEEYWTMIDLTIPGFFAKKAFRSYFIAPIIKSMERGAPPEVVDLARKRTFALLQTVKPFVQRRDLTTLARELPPLLEFIVTVPLTGLQRRLYAGMVAAMRESEEINLLRLYAWCTKICAHPQLLFDLQRRLVGGGSASSSSAAAVAIDRGDNVFDVDAWDSDDDDVAASGSGGSDEEGEEDVMREHTDKKKGDTDRKQRRGQEKKRTREGAHPGSRSNAAAKDGSDEHVGLHDSLVALATPPVGYSAPTSDSMKMLVAIEIIHQAIACGEKVLVFSLSTQLLDWFETALAKAAAERGAPRLAAFLRIDGSVGQRERTELIRQFQHVAAPTAPNRTSSSSDPAVPDGATSPSIFLLSTRATSIGITLTAASRVIILDSSWNPADDRQAVGRAYRYGQTRPVFVYRLLGYGTLEHRIFDQKVGKEWLFDTVVDTTLVKRDHLRGATLTNALRFEDAPPAHRIDDVVRSMTASSIDADRCVLGKLTHESVVSIVRRDTFLEVEQDDEYGAAEEAYYQQYLRRGGIDAMFGESATSGEGGSAEAASRAAAYRKEAKSIETQGSLLAAAVANDSFLTRYSVILEAQRRQARHVQWSRENGAAGFCVGAFAPKRRPVDQRALLPLSASHLPPPPGPYVTAGLQEARPRSHVVNVDDDEDQDDRLAVRRVAAVSGRPPSREAASYICVDDD
mgnify:FL=1